MSIRTSERPSPAPALDAVLFDLDGTLLDVDGEAFLDAYVEALAGFWGAPEQATFQQLVMAAAVPIFTPHPRQTNGGVFRRHLARYLGLTEEAVMQRMRDFDNVGVRGIDIPHRPVPGARGCVQACLELGLRVAVATTPIYTPEVISLRLEWAGLADLPWHLVTHSEIMHACKPHPAYYVEAARLLDAPAAACVMVGDDASQDGPALAAGMSLLMRQGEGGDGWSDLTQVTGWVRRRAAFGAMEPAAAPELL